MTDVQDIRPRAAATLALLCGMNLLDYIDRNILAAVLPHIQAEMGLSSLQAGALGPAFLIAYTAFAPFMGWAGDRYHRPRRLVLGDGLVPVQPPAPVSGRDYRVLRHNRSYVYNVLGMALMTFALGGLALWMPTYFHRIKGMTLQEANLWIGPLTVGAGLLGTMTGGWLAYRLLQR